jgi:RNA polymerase sigma-70 factor (ECF subfamily)
VTAIVSSVPAGELGPGVVERARNGDTQAFTELIRHHDAGLRALAYRLLGDRDRMDDVLQEAYVKAYRGLQGFGGRASVGTWLYRIAYNTCLDELRRSSRVVDLPLAEVGERRDMRPGVAETVAHRRHLAEALSSLTPEDRATVLLVDGQGFDYREAGEVLGIPQGTVASRLNRARAQLRRALSEDMRGVSEG